MLRDVKSSYTLAAALAAISQVAATVNSAQVDHANANSATFFINAGTFGASATLDAKLQYSDNGTDWTDEDGLSGNDTAVTQMTAAGVAQLNVVNPQGRYSRVVATVAVAAVVFGVTSVLGPLRTIAPTDL